MTHVKTLAGIAIFGALFVSQATASPIIYEGKNPAISPGASPLYGSTLDQRAGLSRPKEKRASSSNGGISDADLLRRSVLSGLASHYQSILTGSTSGNGTINFGDGNSADYSTSGGIRTIIFHNLDGTSTTISFPI